MRIQVARKPVSSVRAGVLVVPAFSSKGQSTSGGAGGKTDFKNETVKDFLEGNPKFGKLYETQLLYSRREKVLLVGAGEKDKVGYERLQNWVGTAVKTLLMQAKDITLVLPEAKNTPLEKIAEAVAIGASVASHDPSREYKSEKQPRAKLQAIEVVASAGGTSFVRGIKRGTVLSDAIDKARALGDMPPNEMTPTYFLKRAKELATREKLKITVLSEPQAKRKGMGAFVAVSRGSEEPSYMIALEYRGNASSKEKWGLVGKGVTFDSGGISIKRDDDMHEMKYDMCGAAAVLGAIAVISQLKLKVNAVGIMIVTENLPSGRSFRPGDIVKTYSGKTAEILNTDAEGRLLLADGLAWVQKDFKATKLVDLATLTGAIIVALGDFITGVFGNNPKFTQDLVMTGARVGEKFWELPMDEEYSEMIKSDFADITNIGHGGSLPGAAGAITGAKFVEAAIRDNRPWVHLDIAGTAWDMKAKPYRGVGATGVGIKTLVELLDRNP
ncbi:MAG: leucyl aminopeptidase [Candidatus Blackburnbacteria bacterium]|nr:leucyl aminopeptidase [Candidatus Blackburnbacteria bacterium]